MVFCYILIVIFHFWGSAVVPPRKGAEKRIFPKKIAAKSFEFLTFSGRFWRGRVSDRPASKSEQNQRKAEQGIAKPSIA